MVIDFFTIICGPCITYAPMINESYNHFGCNASNVIFLGINWGTDNAGVDNFGITNGVFYPEVSGTEGNGNHVVDDYSILSYPTVILILPNYFIAENYIWPPTTTNLDSIIAYYGGVSGTCNVSLNENNMAGSGQGQISSIYPQPAQIEVNCVTTSSTGNTLQLYSTAGIAVTPVKAVSPDNNTTVKINYLKPGFYIFVMRNSNGMIIGSRTLTVSK